MALIALVLPAGAGSTNDTIIYLALANNVRLLTVAHNGSLHVKPVFELSLHPTQFLQRTGGRVVVTVYENPDTCRPMMVYTGFGNTPKVAALVKGVKAGISAKKVSTMIDSVKTGMAAKKATPIPKKATPVPKKDNLPFHLMMNIRKMATDSSKQDNEKPYIKLQQMFDTRLAFWTKVNKEILDDTSPNSFASREKRLVVDERKQRYKKRYTKQLVREYIALHQMGCKINKKYFDLFWAQEATISAYKFKHKANLVHFENGSQNNNPIYKALFDTKQQILHQYAPIAHYTALKIVNDWKFEALKDASWKMGYNSNNCEWVKK